MAKGSLVSASNMLKTVSDVNESKIQRNKMGGNKTDF